MACHPDLVLRSKANATSFVPLESEATICRLCNEFAEDAIQSKCHHIFDRECIRQYLTSTFEDQVCNGFSPGCFCLTHLLPSLIARSVMLLLPLTWRHPLLNLTRAYRMRGRACWADWILTLGDHLRRSKHLLKN